MRKFTLITFFSLLLVLALVACGGGNDATDSGGDSGAVSGVDASTGEELYNKVTIGPASAPGCVTCHSLEDGVVLVGPSHAGVGARAASYVAGQSAEDYLHTSIVDPDAHIVDGFTPGVMYQNYQDDLSADEVDALVAYLLTLK